MDIFDYVPKDDYLTVKVERDGKVLTNEDGSEMYIEVWLPHSKEFKKVRHEQSDELMEKQKTKLKSAELEELGLELLAKTTKGWNITAGEEAPKFSVKKAKEIYAKAEWIVDLIEEKKAEHIAFTQGNVKP